MGSNPTGTTLGNVPQLEEGTGLDPVQCGFESHRSHVLTYAIFMNRKWTMIETVHLGWITQITEQNTRSLYQIRWMLHNADNNLRIVKRDKKIPGILEADNLPKWILMT